MSYTKEEKMRVLKEIETDGNCFIVDVSDPTRTKFHRILHLMLHGEELEQGDYYPICENTRCVNPEHRFERRTPMGNAYIQDKARLGQKESKYNE